MDLNKKEEITIFHLMIIIKMHSLSWILPGFCEDFSQNTIYVLIIII